MQTDPDRQTVGTGQTATIRCIVTGNPEPTIKWAKVREELPRNAQVTQKFLHNSVWLREIMS